MHIIVCVKAVRSELVSKSNREKENYQINPYDAYILNQAVEIKSRQTCEVTCVTMGVRDTFGIAKKCLAMGADNAVMLSDKEFSASDTFATSKILSRAINKIGNYDYIFCGSKAIDGETGQTVYGIAERLKIQCISNVDKILHIDVANAEFLCKEDMYWKILNCTAPCVVSFYNFTLTEEVKSLIHLKKAHEKTIQVYNRLDLEMEQSQCGQKGSKTKVIEIKSNIMESNNAVPIQGECQEIVDQMLQVIYLKN